MRCEIINHCYLLLDRWLSLLPRGHGVTRVRGRRDSLLTRKRSLNDNAICWSTISEGLTTYFLIYRLVFCQSRCQMGELPESLWVT